MKTDNKPSDQDNAERILLAALQLFSSKGYAGTSIREIVNVADVTNPMVYYYFGNKEGLFHGLLDAMQDEYHARLIATTSNATSPREFVEACISVEVDGFRENPQVYRFIYSVLFGPPGSFPDHNMFKRHDELEQKLEKTWEKVIPASYESVGIGLLFGLIHAWIMGALRRWESADENEKDAVTQQITEEGTSCLSDFFLNGIGLS